MLSTGRSRRRWRRGSARPTGERPPPQNPEPPQQPRDTPRTPKKNPKPSQQPAGSSPALLRSPFAHSREGHPALGIGGMRLWDSLGGSLKSPTSLGGVGGAWGGAVRVMRMGVLSIGGGGGCLQEVRVCCPPLPRFPKFRGAHPPPWFSAGSEVWVPSPGRASQRWSFPSASLVAVTRPTQRTGIPTASLHPQHPRRRWGPPPASGVPHA